MSAAEPAVEAVKAQARSDARLELALITTTVLLYAGGWVAAEFAIRTIAPLSLAAWRFVIAGAILVGFARLTHRSLGLDRPKTIFALALFGIAIGHAFYYWGLRLAPATDGTVLNTALTPILTMAAGVVALHERISRRGILGAAVAIAGVLLVVVGPRERGGELVLLGDLLLAVGASSIAIYTVLGRVAMTEGSAIGVAGSSTLFAGLMLLPFALLTEPPFAPGSWSVETWLAFGYLHDSVRRLRLGGLLHPRPQLRDHSGDARPVHRAGRRLRPQRVALPRGAYASPTRRIAPHCPGHPPCPHRSANGDRGSRTRLTWVPRQAPRSSTVDSWRDVSHAPRGGIAPLPI